MICTLPLPLNSNVPFLRRVLIRMFLSPFSNSLPYFCLCVNFVFIPLELVVCSCCMELGLVVKFVFSLVLLNCCRVYLGLWLI